MNRHDIFWKTAVRIRDTYRDHVKGEEAYVYSEDAARELQDAGLLAPDLPEPRINIGEWQEWGRKHGNCVTLHYDTVTVEIPDDISRDLTIGQARELAAWLNAAADYSERNQE